MRNADKIKALEKELGRYRKKVADQGKELNQLKEKLRTAYAGNIEINRTVDSVLAQTALAYGEDIRDEESGVSLGRRLVLPISSIGKVLGKYEVKARRDDMEQVYYIAVVPREQAEAEATPAAGDVE